MIELFSLLKEKRSKSLKMKCDRIPHWKMTERTQVNSLVNYIKDNGELFYIKRFEVHYDKESRTQSFDIELETDYNTYEYLIENYNYIIDKYDKYTISLDDVRFMNFNKKDLSRLRIH